jgi:hypothetical protein
MTASKEVCTVCDKPFHGRQKIIRCGGCDSRFRCVCLKISDTEFSFYTASGKSSYQCSACTKLQKVSAVKMQRSLFASDANKKIHSPERQLILPTLRTKEALSVQIEAVRVSGEDTMEMAENCKLSDEVAHLKLDNVELKK